jgi:methylenetetrahydrofolate dehydrogenase (NADP+) / methenyltetrahydrofolate cyclohydrolase
MTPILLDGKATAAAIRTELASALAERMSAGVVRPPHLVAVLVGASPASQLYVNAKAKACAEIGFRGTVLERPDSISETELLELIAQLNADPGVDGMIVQLPLPKHINEKKVTEAILPEKDVDGFHPVNLGRMVLGLPALLPATPAGVVDLLRRSGIATSSLHAVVVGRSHIVGSPLSILLARNLPEGNCTVTLCHSRTRDLASHTRQADLLIAAAGQVGLIGPEHVREGAVVVDVGTHRVEDVSKKVGYRVVGDVQFDAVAPLCRAITPVPGGVGPMTIAQLLQNTWQAWDQRKL